MEYNVLALAHLHKLHKNYNRIFEDWCEGIRANSGNYHFMDYVELYSDIGKKAFEEHVEGFMEEKKIDCVFIAFYSGDLTLDMNFLERLSKRSFLVMGFFDTEHYFEAVDRYYAQCADLVLLPDYLSKFRYELLNINALCTFSLIDKQYYKKLDAKEKSIDVSFVGDMAKGNRREYIDYLSANSIPIKCYGHNTENGPVDFEKMIDVFNRSKININFTGAVDNSSLILGSGINNRIKQSKGRPVEIALCGGFVLTEYAPGIENMFEIGKEMGVFHSAEELAEKIRYYLRNESEREEIAQRGYERALRDYETRAGFSKLFDIIRKTKKEKHEIFLDDDFIRNYTSYRFCYLPKFAIDLKPLHLIQEITTVFRYRKLGISRAYRYALKAVLEKISIYLNKRPHLRQALRKFIHIKAGS